MLHMPRLYHKIVSLLTPISETRQILQYMCTPANKLSTALDTATTRTGPLQTVFAQLQQPCCISAACNRMCTCYYLA